MFRTKIDAALKRRNSKRRNYAAASVFLSLICLTSVTALYFGFPDSISGQHQDKIITVLKKDSRLTREGLSKLKTITPKAAPSVVFATLGVPLAQLNDLEKTKAGTLKQYSYPLAFNPETQAVLLFKDEQLIGYRFLFNLPLPK